MKEIIQKIVFPLVLRRFSLQLEPRVLIDDLTESGILWLEALEQVINDMKTINKKYTER